MVLLGCVCEVRNVREKIVVLEVADNRRPGKRLERLGGREKVPNVCEKLTRHCSMLLTSEGHKGTDRGTFAGDRNPSGHV